MHDSTAFKSTAVYHDASSHDDRVEYVLADKACGIDRPGPYKEFKYFSGSTIGLSLKIILKPPRQSIPGGRLHRLKVWSGTLLSTEVMVELIAWLSAKYMRLNQY